MLFSQFCQLSFPVHPVLGVRGSTLSVTNGQTEEQKFSCLILDYDGGIWMNTALYLWNLLRALPSGTPPGGGIYLTV